MSFNLIEEVKTALLGDTSNKIAGMLGESTAKIQQAIQEAIPFILTSILYKADSGNIHETMNLATNAAWLEIPFNKKYLVDKNGDSKEMDFLISLFGEKTPNLSNTIARDASISNQSAATVLSIAAPAALAVLGKYILTTNMNEKGFQSLLNSYRKRILDLLPAGVYLEGIMNGENNSRISKKSKWIINIVIILLAFLALWYYKTLQKPPDILTRPAIDSPIISKDTIKQEIRPTTIFSIKLPDGTALNSKEGSIEDQLVNFFNNPKSKSSRKFQFTFDQLYFTSGTTNIKNESVLQVQNIAAILNAYPKVKIKIGGFNEKGGDSLANKILSENRAVTVAAAIKSAGANSNQIIGVEGFGSDYAKYPADAADSLREKDNRISISVRSK
jgi:outer membrane protein OmpA-like peptidoglycan-associated protein